MANYYLTTSSELLESNIGILKDGRDAGERLQVMLQEHFDDESIQVNSLEWHDKDVFAVAKCSRDEFGTDEPSIEMFNVKLERTFIY